MIVINPIEEPQHLLDVARCLTVERNTAPSINRSTSGIIRRNREGHRPIMI